MTNTAKYVYLNIIQIYLAHPLKFKALTLVHMAYFPPVFQLIPHGKRSHMTFEARPPSPLPHNGGIVII